ncbi:MAG: tetratricopeptide repeat protein [Pseudomonadota bacterium]
MAAITKTAEDVVKKIVAQQVPKVTDGDAAILAETPNRSTLMEKLLAVYWNQKGEYKKALGHAETAFVDERTAENAKNIVMLYRRTGDWEAGIEFCERHQDTLEPIQANDLLCMLYRMAGDDAQAARYGDETLRLKDATTEPAPTLAPQIKRFNPETPDRNVIAFSLWGNDRRYTHGAVNNAVVARYLYPGWRTRFYVDAEISNEVVQALAGNGALVIQVGKAMPADSFGLFWRFLVEDDPDVDIWLCRDADSVMNIKERVAVEDWLASGRAFHVMRDVPSHAELILAGMWGAHRGNIGNMRKRIEDHVASAPKALNNRITDQEFLRRSIWPIVRQDVLVHDSYFTFGNPSRFRDEFQLPKNRHIGQNDWVHTSETKKA